VKGRKEEKKKEKKKTEPLKDKTAVVLLNTSPNENMSKRSE
jgi:hypothetical protein